MNTWLKRRAKEKFGSMAKLAKALMKEVSLDMTEESLATEIGRLAKGQDGWWQRRTDVTQGLADLLECEVEELLGAGTDTTDGSSLAFKEFPRLRPLRLDEAPSNLDGGGWLIGEVVTEKPHRWVVASAGSGKSLLVRYLQLRDAEGGPRGVVARTLAEAQHLVHGGRPVVVEIEHADEGDREAFLELSRKTVALTALAPFDPPVGMNHERTVADGAWTVRRWRPEGTWRHRLLHWIAERVPKDADHLFDLKQTSDWLAQHDPNHELVRTPGDLLTLCSITFAVGLPATKKLQSLAKPWLDGLAVSMSVPSDDARVWLRRYGTRVVKGLVERSFAAAHHQLHDIDADGWASLLDDGASIGSASVSQVRARLEALANEGSKARRRRAVDKLTRSLTGGTAHEAIATLTENDILRGSDGGGYAVFPRWAAEAIRQQHLAKLLTKGDVAAWGSLAADPHRRRCIDRALQQLSTRALTVLVDRVVTTFTDDLAAAGAVEACFAEAGRRLAEDAALVDGAMQGLQALARLQIGLLAKRYGGDDDEPVPVTRGQDGNALATWLASSWPFSFRVPRPKGLRLKALDWHFPGWARNLSLSAPPGDMPWSRGETQAIQSGGGRDWYAPSPGRTRATKAVETIAAFAGAAIANCKLAPLPNKLPRILLPAMILALDDGWVVTDVHVRQLRRSWEEEHLVEQLAQLADDDRAGVVHRLWATMVREPTAEGLAAADLPTRIESFQRDLPLLAASVLETLAPEHFAEDVASLGFGSNPNVLHSLPRKLRSMALRAWAEQDGRRATNLHAIREMLAGASADDVDLLIDLAEQVERGADADYFAIVWQHAPERALAEALSALSSRSPRAQGWCWSAPASAIPALADAIESTPPAWVAKWALRRLPVGGAAAPRLYRLARG